jgi:hypothetical protein
MFFKRKIIIHNEFYCFFFVKCCFFGQINYGFFVWDFMDRASFKWNISKSFGWVVNWIMEKIMGKLVDKDFGRKLP